MTKTPKRPRDPNQLAKAIVDLTTGEAPETETLLTPMAELGRAGGLIGGHARARALSPDRRSDIARDAARKRWTS